MRHRHGDDIRRPELKAAGSPIVKESERGSVQVCFLKKQKTERSERLIEIGLRRDGGDAENGAGKDFGGGLVIADSISGLGVDLRWRTMVVHQAEQFGERGVAVTFSYEPRSTRYGLRARIAPSWGANATGSADTLWRGDVMSRSGYGDNSGRLDGEVGYGLPLGRLTGTPRFGFSNAGHGRMYRIGYV